MRTGTCADRKGFTLLELLMVLAIIGVLAALLLPALSAAKGSAHSAACQNHLRQMGVALKTYVDDNRSRFPYYLGPPGLAFGDATFPGGRRGRGKGGVYWSTKLFPYYPLNWTNRAFHCPAYKGAIAGPPPRVVNTELCRLGGYAYNVSGAGAQDYTRYYGGLGPPITWGLPPVAEGKLKVPAEMLAISDSQFVSPAVNQMPGGMDTLIATLGGGGNSFDAALHGRKHNQLWCDGHVAAMNPWALFNRTNSAALWNFDHQPHPEWWEPAE